MINIPKAFNDCVKSGGKVRTIKLKNNKFMRLCFFEGKSFSGEVKTKEQMKKLLDDYKKVNSKN